MKKEKKESSKKKNIGVALEYLNKKNDFDELKKEIEELGKQLKGTGTSSEDPEKIALSILRGYSEENYKLEDDWSDKMFGETQASNKKIVKAGLDRILATQIPRVAEELNLSETCQRRAINIIRKAENLGIAYGKKPASVLAAAIYMAATDCSEYRSEVEVSQITGISKSSLFEVYKEFSEVLK